MRRRNNSLSNNEGKERKTMIHKLITVICALALVLGLSLSATAAVQNVKVGGDIDIKGIWQSDYNIYGSSDQPKVNDYLMTITRLYVEASLTDNVSAMVRVLNDRDWSAIRAPQSWTSGNDVELDLAYLKLSDMYGYPFSLTIGRQELKYGEGFLVGDGVRFGQEGNSYYEYGPRKAFDAIKLEWDYAPHKIDLFTAKIYETSDQPHPYNYDCDLYGADWNYDGGVYGLWDFALFYVKESPDDFDQYSASIRGEGNIPQVSSGTLALKGEIVKQWGQVGDPGDKVDIDAWGGYAEGQYTFDNPYAPYFGAGYIFMSGDNRNTKKDEQFFAPFEDEKYGEIAEVMYGFYLTGFDTNISNASIWKLSGGFNPTQATNVDLTFYNYTADKAYIDGVNQKKYIGSEYDVTFNYNYSEDVSFGLLYGIFYTGDFFKDGDIGYDVKDNAKELVGSVKVTF